MRGGHHEHAGIPEVSQGQTECDMALFFVHWNDAHLRARNETESGCEGDAYHDRGARPEPHDRGAGL
jgi:hypothetical protein